MVKLVAESIQYYLNEEKLKGGKADDLKPGEVCPKQLSMGKIVEKEHSTDKKTSKEIAEDHLKENPEYYSDMVEKGMIPMDEEPVIKKYVEHFGKDKLPDKYKRMLEKIKNTKK